MFAPRSARGRRNRAIASLIAAGTLIITPAFASPAQGQPDPDDPASTPYKGAPETAAPAAPPAPECDLNEGDSAQDEFAHCTNVVVDFTTTPDVGETTTVDVSVTAVGDVDSGTLTVLVNDLFDIVDAGGFADAGTKPSGVGPLAAVSRSISLTADQTESFSIEVSGDRAGIGVVQARFRTAGGMFDGGDEASAQLGQAAPTPERGLPTTPAPADASQAAPTPGTAPYRKAPLDGSQSLSPQAPNASCATGRWVFNDENGLQNSSVNFQVQVWDADSPSDDDHLATGVTNGSGNYNLCFESTDGEGGGQEVYVRFISSNNAWRVRNTPAADDNYVFSTGVINLADPGTANFGTLQPANAASHRALHAFDGINRLWLWHASIHNFLDNPGQSRQMIVNWTSTSTDGTYYSLGGNDIHLAAADPDADHVTIHEGAHGLMDAIYNDDYPPFPNCNPHFIFGASSTGCAWTEGWAEWVPARVLNDPFFRFPSGSSVNLETPSWTTNTSAYGDAVEGRVAGALIDLSDFNNEASWDRFGEGGSNAASEEIYATNLIQVSDTLNEFFNTDRPGEGDTGFFARAALFQNTIDYTHRDPLVSEQELLRPSLASAPNPHNYSYTATSSFWGGVAIRMTADFDLRLYDDQAQTVLLDSSLFGTGTIDYIVVDGNHNTGSFFPRVSLFSGDANYRIEEFTGNDTLGLGSEGESFGSADVIKPFDAFVNAGQTNYIGVDPSGGLDLELFAHDSNGTAADAVQRRSESVDSSDDGGGGVPEYVSYSSPDSDWTGIVVLNQGGSGSYTIYRDTAGPGSPSVLIDNGNTNTYDTTVDLDLSATAANGSGNSPLVDMQISTDGVFNSEPWVPYATSATVTVPGGLGTKTVWARFRNAAGAISSVASDTINLVVPPNCDGQTPTIFGDGVINGTAGNDVIVGSEFNDTIQGGGGNDVICGLDGNDTIADGPGSDSVFGGAGNDVFNQPAAMDPGDVLNGGPGTDRVSYVARTADLTVKLDAAANDGQAGEGDKVVSNVENVWTGSGDDVINGNGRVNNFQSRAGNDTLNGGGNADVLDGGSGNDTLTGAGGADLILGSTGDDTVNEGGGANGADVIKGGGGTDRISYVTRASSTTIRLNGAATSGAAGENDSLIGFEEAVGGSGHDLIVGTAKAEWLIGNAGNDEMHGLGGNDQVNGGAGNDTLTGDGGDDWLHSKDGVSGNDSVNGGTGTDTAIVDVGDTVINVP